MLDFRPGPSSRLSVFSVSTIFALLICQPVLAKSMAPANPAIHASASASAVHQPAQKSSNKRILIMDLSPVGVDPGLVTVLGGLIIDAVAKHPNLQTISTDDIRNLVELEQGKQQVGCDSNSCLAEVAGAMGAEFVIFGNIGMLGSTTVVNLSLFDAAKAQAVARRSIKVANHEALAKEIQPAMNDLLRDLRPAAPIVSATVTTENAALSSPSPTSSPATPSPTAKTTTGRDMGWLLWTGAIVGTVSAVSLAATYVSLISSATSMGAPAEFLQLANVPVIGPFTAAEKLNDDDGAPSWVAPTTQAVGVTEAVLALGSVTGLSLFSLGRALDGQGLSLAGHAWQWGLVMLGGGLTAGGLALDFYPDSSQDHSLALIDAAPLAMYLGAAISVSVGLFFNPFVKGEE